MVTRRFRQYTEPELFATLIVPDASKNTREVLLAEGSSDMWADESSDTCLNLCS